MAISHYPITNFNTLEYIDNIIKYYKTNFFPNAYCLLVNKNELLNALTTEKTEIIESQNKKVVIINGRRINLHKN